MDVLLDLLGALVLENFVEVGVGGDCVTLLNLRDFRSEARVLGNCTTLRFVNEAEGKPVMGVDAWVEFALIAWVSFTGLFFNEVPDAPLMRRFLRGRWLLVLSDVSDVADARVDEEARGMSWQSTVPDLSKKTERIDESDIQKPLEALFTPWTGVDGGGMETPVVRCSSRAIGDSKNASRSAINGQVSN